jgi:hypothetical protein
MISKFFEACKIYLIKHINLYKKEIKSNEDDNKYILKNKLLPYKSIKIKDL